MVDRDRGISRREFLQGGVAWAAVTILPDIKLQEQDPLLLPSAVEVVTPDAGIEVVPYTGSSDQYLEFRWDALINAARETSSYLTQNAMEGVPYSLVIPGHRILNENNELVIVPTPTSPELPSVPVYASMPNMGIFFMPERSDFSGYVSDNTSFLQAIGVLDEQNQLTDSQESIGDLSHLYILPTVDNELRAINRNTKEVYAVGVPNEETGRIVWEGKLVYDTTTKEFLNPDIRRLSQGELEGYDNGIEFYLDGDRIRVLTNIPGHTLRNVDVDRLHDVIHFLEQTRAVGINGNTTIKFTLNPTGDGVPGMIQSVDLDSRGRYAEVYLEEPIIASDGTKIEPVYMTQQTFDDYNQTFPLQDGIERFRVNLVIDNAIVAALWAANTRLTRINDTILRFRQDYGYLDISNSSYNPPY